MPRRINRPGRRPGIGGGARGQRLAAGAAAYRSPNIAGDQEGGYGFSPGAYNSGTTMEQIARNEYLNTLSIPDRERYMAQTGYFTGGIPKTIPKTSRASIRDYAMQPGHTAAGLYVMPDRSGQFELSAPGVLVPGSVEAYRPAGGGNRPGRPSLVGGQAYNNPGGRPGAPGRGRPPGFGHPQPGDIRPTLPGFQGPRRPGGGGGGGRPGGGQGGGQGGGGGGSLSDFLPMTAGFEGARRQLEDQLARSETDLMLAQGLIDPQLQLQLARLGTDQGYATDSLKENLANRGIFSSGGGPEGFSGVGEYLYGRDIASPFGRATQDLGLGAAQQYADLSSQLGESYLGYNQGIMEALLNRAAEVSQDLPLSLPQYDGGGRNRPRRGRRGRGRNRGGKK